MIKYHYDIEQNTDEWFKARSGIITASVVDSLITKKTMAIALNNTVRMLAYKYAAQRLTGYLEDNFQSFHMIRGHLEEGLARDIYSKEVEEVKQCGFITRQEDTFTIGYSPDGLVGEDGVIEIKSKIPKLQVDTILKGKVPSEYTMQIQTGLFVSGRKWCDFISYSNGMPMFIERVWPDKELHSKIAEAVEMFEKQVLTVIAEYKKRTIGMIKTERVEMNFDDEITIGGL